MSINYYCCITSYLKEAPNKTEGLNKTVLDLEVDIDTLENRNDCKVGGWEDVLGRLEGQTNLCQTISPKYSCVIAYASGTVSEGGVFYIPESIEAGVN